MSDSIFRKTKIRGTWAILPLNPGEQPPQAIFFSQLAPIDVSALMEKDPWALNGVLILIVENCGGSDYGGGPVTKANYTWVVENWGKAVIGLLGGYGSYGIGIPHDILERHPEATRLLEILEKTNDYQLIDEDALLGIEEKMIEEAWESWARADFKTLLVSEVEEYFAGWLDTLSSAEVRKLFDTLKEDYVEWSFSSEGAFTDMGEIEPTDEEIVDLLKRVIESKEKSK